MATEVTIPHLGYTMKVAKISKWLKSVGDQVQRGEILLEIETDKVNYAIDSPTSGVVKLILADIGDEVPVGYIVAVIGEADEELDIDLYHKGKRTKTILEEIQVKESSEAAAYGVKPEKPASAEAAPAAPAIDRVKASPLARSIARKYGLDLSLITGSGAGGRITHADVLKALEEILPSRATAPALEDVEALAAAEVIPISGLRKLTFDNVHLSITSQAQLTIHTETSATQLIELCRALNQRYMAEGGREGGEVLFNAILVKIIALALKRHPYVNATVEGQTINVWRQIHIGVAMELEDGLIVPKVRRPDEKSIKEIAMIIDDLFTRARERKLLPDEIQGGTFTLTNLGSWDTDYFTPIVNLPESATLGVGRIVDKPWAREGLVVIEPKISLSLTFDSRIIDGAPAAQFLNTIKDMVESPVLMLE